MTILSDIGVLTRLDAESPEPSAKQEQPPKPKGPVLSDTF